MVTFEVSHDSKGRSKFLQLQNIIVILVTFDVFVFINQNLYFLFFIFIIVFYKVFYYFKDKHFNFNLSKKVSVDKFHNIVNISNHSDANSDANSDASNDIEICRIPSIDCDDPVEDSIFIDSSSSSSSESDSESDSNLSYNLSSICSSDLDSSDNYLSYCSDSSWSA